MNVVCISGSPSSRSRSAWLLNLARHRLEGMAASCRLIGLRDLPADALIRADKASEPIRDAVAYVAEADVVIVSTPIYQASFSGLLKLFIDLLPQDALRHKKVMALATGGSVAHLLALEYALKPVLSSIGARNILDGVFATHAQLVALDSGGYDPDTSLVERLEQALRPLTEARLAHLSVA